MRQLLGVVAVAIVLVATPARAWDGSVDLSAQSAYIWRGMVLNDEPVFQPSVTLSQGGFSASVWSSVDLTDVSGHRLEPTEVDYWLAYTYQLEPVAFTLTAYGYSFPNSAAASTQELWAGVTWSTLFKPTLTVVRDVNVADGTYLLLSGTQSLGVLEGPSSDGLALTVNIGHATRSYTRSYFPDLAAGHVNDYGVRLDWPLRIGPGTLKLDLQYTAFTDSGVESPGFEGRTTHLAGGLTFSVPFRL
jgi:uncharacterized protein (TIGR02001 family)